MGYGQIFSESWNNIKDSLIAYVIALIVYVIGSTLIITTPPLLYGIFHMTVKTARSEPVAVEDVFEGFRNGNFLRSWILLIVLVIVSVILYGIGMLLSLFIIGVIGVISTDLVTICSFGLVAILYIAYMAFMLGLTYMMPLYVMRRYGAIEAIKESFYIFKNNILFTIGLQILVALTAFAGLIAFGVGVFITAPLSYVMLTTATMAKAGDNQVSECDQ